MGNREPVQFAANEPVEVSFKYPDGKLIDTAFGQKTMYSTTDGKVLFAEAELASKINFVEPQPGQCLWITKRVIFRGKGKGREIFWEVSSSEPGTIRRDGYQKPAPPDTRENAAAMGIDESDLERQLRESHEMVKAKAANRVQAKENVARMENAAPVADTPNSLKETPNSLKETFSDLIDAMDAPAVERKPVQKALTATPEASDPRPNWYEPLVAQTKQLIDALVEVRQHAGKHGTLISADDCEKLLVTCLIGKQRQRA